MRLKHMSRRTEASYPHYILDFIRFAASGIRVRWEWISKEAKSMTQTIPDMMQTPAIGGNQ
jgi:hypothetical protein